MNVPTQRTSDWFSKRRTCEYYDEKDVIIILLSKTVDIHWAVQNKEYWINKGYEFTKYGAKFSVLVSELYETANAKVKIKCDICGKEYWLPFCRYIENLNNFGKTVCYSCSREILLQRRWESNKEERIDKAYKIALDSCNKKGYVLLSQKNTIENVDSFVDYLCPKHGIHSMKINNLRSGKGCPDCRKDEASAKFRMPMEEIIKRVDECGSKILNPEDYINNSERNLVITCPLCGQPFTTSFVLFTQHGGQLCSQCYRKESVGERKVREYLEKNNIEYISQKWFKDCRDINPLPFDFYLPMHNTIIEFDGEQHSKDASKFFHKSYDLQIVKKHDQIKTQYCFDKGIQLIRIPYTEMKNINTILDEKLKYSHEDIV